MSAIGLRQVPMRWKEWRGQLSEEKRAVLLLAIWALVILGFFSFSTRQEYYVLPALPASCAVLAGMWLAERRKIPGRMKSAARRSGRVWRHRFFARTGNLDFPDRGHAGGGSAAASGRHRFRGCAAKKTPLSIPSPWAILLTWTPKALGALRLPLPLTSLGFLAGTTLNWWFRRRNHPAKGNLALAGMMVVVHFVRYIWLWESSIRC